MTFPINPEPTPLIFWHTILISIAVAFILLFVLYVFRKQLRLIKHFKTIQLYVTALFPSARSYFNFWMLFIFTITLYYIRDLLTVLVSAFASGYFLNEWIKEILATKETTTKCT